MAGSKKSNALAADRPHGLPKAIVQSLQDPSVYGHYMAKVKTIETHISWVFLTDRFAYKLKKPVHFDFLDFSTLELRHQACKHEVELNRRLAPGVYLGVVPVVRTASGELAVDGQGTPVDWLVKMKRLPADSALDVLIRKGTLSASAIMRLAETLTTFYENVRPEVLKVENYRSNIEQHVMANRAELAASAHHLDTSKVRRIHAAQLRVLRLLPDLLDDRVRNARIVDGHGDLRPEHIYFTPSPIVIDCVEFNREFRTLDVIDELAFLSMECNLLGAEEIVEPIFKRYMERSGDAPSHLLIAFYRTYRACVRAKVSALRAEQLTGELCSRQLALANKYLDLADQYSQSLGPPLLVLVRGLPGTGKSTIAQMLSEQLDWDLLQTDALRKTIYGANSEHSSFNDGRYHPENRLRVYKTMHAQAEQLLSSGMSVVLDGTYSSASLRTDAQRLAKRKRAECLVLHCHCPTEIALQRIKSRIQTGSSLSETRPEFFEQQQREEEPDSSDQQSLEVDTSDSSSELIRRVFAAIRKRCFDETGTREQFV